MTLAFGHAYTDPRTLPIPLGGGNLRVIDVEWSDQDDDLRGR